MTLRRLFQTFVVNLPIYSMVASAKHEGVVFVVTPTHGDKRSGVCDAGGLLIGSGLFLHVDVCV